MTEKTKTPAIRFMGFADDWELRKLGEVVTIKSGASPSGFDDGSFIYVKVDDLNHSDRVQNNSQMTVAVNSRCQQVTKGSVIFPKRGAAIMTNKARIMGKTGYMDTNMMALEPVGVESDFLYLFICKTGLFKIADTSTIPQINNKHIEPYEIFIPTVEEQQQIGAFFRALDSLIALHQRKYEKLRNVKKSCLEKMFPKAGSKVPEIRFKGFTDPWEQRKFGDMATRNSATAVCSSELPSVEYEDIVSGQGILNKNIWEKQNIKTGICFEPGDVLFGKLRPYLKNWILPDFSGVAVGDFWVLHPSEIDNRYLYYLIQTPAFQTAANQSTGTKMPRSDWNLVSKAEFFAPQDIIEQRRIGVTLQSIDALITLHQRELEKLQNLKKACLEKMFV